MTHADMHSHIDTHAHASVWVRCADVSVWLYMHFVRVELGARVQHAHV